jgi:hypothetical protein
VLDVLAAVWAEEGRFELAVATAEKAIMLVRNADPMELVEEISERLALYRTGQAYREDPAARWSEYFARLSHSESNTANPDSREERL